MALVTRKLRSPRARHARIDHIFELITRVVLVLYMIWATVVWISEREMFRIDTITIAGNRVVSEDRITLIAQDIMVPRFFGIVRSNTLFTPLSRIRLSIAKESDWIKSVRIAKRPRALDILVEERNPYFLWCPLLKEDLMASSSSNELPGIIFDGCYFADETGYVFGAAPMYSGYPFIVYTSAGTSSVAAIATGTPMTIGSFILPKDELTRVFRLQRLLADQGVAIRQVVAYDPGDYLLRVDRPWRLYVSTLVEPEEIVRRLNLVEEEIAKEHDTSISVIDLRFGNKIFYR